MKTDEDILSDSRLTVEELVRGLGVLGVSPEEEEIILDDCKRIYEQSANLIGIMLEERSRRRKVH